MKQYMVQRVISSDLFASSYVANFIFCSLEPKVKLIGRSEGDVYPLRGYLYQWISAYVEGMTQLVWRDTAIKC